MSAWDGKERRAGFRDFGERLSNVEIQMVRLVSHIESETGTYLRVHGAINKHLKEHDEMLKGDGRHEAGVVNRVLKLEEIHKDIKFIINTMWITLIGAAGSIAVFVMTNHISFK